MPIVPRKLHRVNCFQEGMLELVSWKVVLDLTALRFETVFQSISGRLPERGREKREVIDERKNVQTTPTRTYCKRNRPLPYYNLNK